MGGWDGGEREGGKRERYTYLAYVLQYHNGVTEVPHMKDW